MFKTAFGWCAIVYRRDPAVVTEILLPRSRKALSEALGPNRCEVAALPLPEPINQLYENIRYYFDNPPHPVPVPWNLLDLSAMTNLQCRVLKATASIPFGQTRSYSDIARAIAAPRAARFVGNTMARNPFPIIIPCHRVVRADHTLGQFGGGTELKRRMLEIEALPCSLQQ